MGREGGRVAMGVVGGDFLLLLVLLTLDVVAVILVFFLLVAVGIVRI